MHYTISYNEIQNVISTVSELHSFFYSNSYTAFDDIKQSIFSRIMLTKGIQGILYTKEIYDILHPLMHISCIKVSSIHLSSEEYNKLKTQYKEIESLHRFVRNEMVCSLTKMESTTNLFISKFLENPELESGNYIFTRLKLNKLAINVDSRLVISICYSNKNLKMFKIYNTRIAKAEIERKLKGFHEWTI